MIVHVHRANGTVFNMHTDLLQSSGIVERGGLVNKASLAEWFTGCCKAIGIALHKQRGSVKMGLGTEWIRWYC